MAGRDNYEELMSTAQDLAEAASGLDNDDERLFPIKEQLVDCVKQANQLFSGASNPRTMHLDSSLLLLCAETSVISNTEKKFDGMVFKERAIAYFGGSENGSVAGIPLDHGFEAYLAEPACWENAPKQNVLFESLCEWDKESQQDTSTSQNDTQASSASSRRTNRRGLEQSSENVVMEKESQGAFSTTGGDATKEHVEKEFKALVLLWKSTGKRSVPLWAFVTDPTSYENTCHHMMFMTYLIHGLRVKVTYTDEEWPLVEPILQKMPSDTKRNARIINFNYEKWNEAIRKYDIRRSVLNIMD